MSRAILETVIQDSAGTVQVGASVYVFEEGTTTPLAQTMYTAASGGTPLANPFPSAALGLVKAYVDRAQRVTIRVNGVSYASEFLTDPVTIAIRPQLPTNAKAPPFNLLGDGITDETTTLQTFLSSIVTSGAYEIPTGTYVISSTLTLSGVSNVVIRGHPGVVIRQVTAGQAGLRLTNGTNVLIDNVNFQGPATAGDTAVSAATEIGLYVVSGGTVVIRDCTVTDFGYKGIESDAAITTIQDCDVTGTGDTLANSVNTGITIFGGKSSILNCRVDNYTNGLSVQSGTRSKVHGNWINQTTPPSAINTASYTNAAYQSYKDNHVYGSAKVSFTANNSVVQGNIFTGSGGLTITHSSGGLCVDNSIDGGSILLSMDDDAGLRPYGLVVGRNHIRRAPVTTAAAGVFTGAITMGSPCRNCIIENNIIEYPYGHGISAYDAGASGAGTQGFENLTIRHNTIRRPAATGGYSAIKLGAGYGESLAGLRIYGNTVESLVADTSLNAVSTNGSATITLTSAAESEKFTPGDFVTGIGITPGTYVIQVLSVAHNLVLSAAVPSGGTTGTLTRTAMRFVYAIDLSQANNGSASAVDIRDDNNFGPVTDYTTGFIAYQIGVLRRDTLAQRHSGVSHTFTALTDFSTYGQTEVLSATDGGALLSGFTETTIAVQVNGNTTTESGTRDASAGAAVVIAGWKPNGTSSQAMTADRNILAVRTGGTNRFFLDSDGDSFQDVGTAWTNYDNHDDVGLLNTLAAHVARPGNAIRDEFRQFVTYNRERLGDIGLVYFNDDGSVFVNMSRLTMLLVGAVRRLGLESSETRQRLERVERQLLALSTGTF